MNKKEQRKFVNEKIRLLKSFPPFSKSKRTAYLKIKRLKNQKVFFNLFCQKIMKPEYALRDKVRRLRLVDELPEFFKQNLPQKNNNDDFILENYKMRVVIKEKNGKLHLLSLYPK